jgi:hypothetical protein
MQRSEELLKDGMLEVLLLVSASVGAAPLFGLIYEQNTSHLR